MTTVRALNCSSALPRRGVPVDGYFNWSSEDNLERENGFGNRFGLIYVDLETLERTPKLSAEWPHEAAHAKRSRLPRGAIP
jgi:beta-glucosidase/6-phospho-beta-glucosidase/beta-galactosidase